MGSNATSDTWCDVGVVRAAVADDTRLEAAVDIYRGDFLDGFSHGDAPEFDDWASIQRERWHREMEAIFNRRFQRQAEADKTRHAIDTVNRWLEVAPLSEQAYRRLMRLHFTAMLCR